MNRVSINIDITVYVCYIKTFLIRAFGHHREEEMNLEVMTDNRLLAMFGKQSVVSDRRVHSVTHLQRKWLQALPAVNRMAIQGARLMCFSYRNFRVGVAGYCYCRATGEFCIVNAGNLKLWQGCCKFCGEMTFRRVIPERFDCIVGISIYGEEVQADPSGHTPRTLHPCPPCRDELEADPRVAPWMRVFTFRPWTPGDPPEERREKFVREHRSFRQLLRLHRNDSRCG